MKKRLLSLLCALALALSLLPAAALAADEDAMLETVRVLGILTGDESGDLDLTGQVTRASFAKLLTAASSYKDTVTGVGTASLFTDVKRGHWAGGYIQLAVEQGWMTGYVDGSFRPDEAVTLEEAATALLRLLGYDASALTGTYPDAQLAKAGAVGLLDGVEAAQGQALTRSDCVPLFYNLLTCQTSAGTVYGTSLGCTVTNGEVDFSALVTAGTKGPYVSTGSLDLPFGTENVTVYRNGTLSTLSAVNRNDVYYYHEDLRTVWVYSDRVTGTLTAVSPSDAAPTSVTVAGNEYALETSAAAYAVSSQGSFTTGQSVTLLLGMNGGVAAVLTPEEGGGVYEGVVLSSAKGASTGDTAAEGAAGVQVTTRVACTDGVERTFYHTGTAYAAGRLVEAVVDASGTTLKGLSTKTLAGSFNAAADHFAGYALAEGVEILDTDGTGGYVLLYPERLSGVSLQAGDVRYYSLDENGAIDRLILDEVTGDTLDYVYLTAAVSSPDGDMSASGSYTYLLDGQSHTLSGSTAYAVSTGGAALKYTDGQVSGFRQLTEVKLTALFEGYAMADNRKYLLADQVQVLLRQGNDYYPTTLDQIDDESYSLTGWYDDLGCPAGGRVRILIATAY